jgi:hypothetical protein
MMVHLSREYLREFVKKIENERGKSGARGEMIHEKT